MMARPVGNGAHQCYSSAVIMYAKIRNDLLCGANLSIVYLVENQNYRWSRKESNFLQTGRFCFHISGHFSFHLSRGFSFSVLSFLNSLMSLPLDSCINDYLFNLCIIPSFFLNVANEGRGELCCESEM